MNKLQTLIKTTAAYLDTNREVLEPETCNQISGALNAYEDSAHQSFVTFEEDVIYELAGLRLHNGDRHFETPKILTTPDELNAMYHKETNNTFVDPTSAVYRLNMVLFANIEYDIVKTYRKPSKDILSIVNNYNSHEYSHVTQEFEDQITYSDTDMVYYDVPFRHYVVIPAAAEECMNMLPSKQRDEVLKRLIHNALCETLPINYQEV